MSDKEIIKIDLIKRYIPLDTHRRECAKEMNVAGNWVSGGWVQCVWTNTWMGGVRTVSGGGSLVVVVSTTLL